MTEITFQQLKNNRKMQFPHKMFEVSKQLNKRKCLRGRFIRNPTKFHKNRNMNRRITLKTILIL